MSIFSIITPIYNGEKYIHDCYKSIINQSLDSWEWIVVDDGSKDNTKNILTEISNSDERVHFYSYKLNQGRGYARNYCIDKSSSKWIVIWDVDDISATNRLEELSKYIDHDYDYIYSTCVLISREYKIYGLRGKNYSRLMRMEVPLHPSLCVSKDFFKFYRYSIFKTIGGIGEDYSVLHTLGKYFRGLYINEPLVYFFEDTEVNVRKAHDSNKAYFLDFMKYSMLCKSMNIFGFWSLLIKLTLFHILKIIPKSEKIYRYSIKFRKSDIIGNPEKEELFLRLQKILSIR